jgi:hypothetical protein
MTFLELQKQLAVMVGAAAPTVLAVTDRTQIKQVINQMYLRCYLPIDGRRPPWAKESLQLFTREPDDIVIELIAGSDAFAVISPGKYPLVTDYVGSDIELDRYTFKLGRVATDDMRLVGRSPVSGQFAARVFTNVIALPERVVDLDAHVLFDGVALTPVAKEGPMKRVEKSQTYNYVDVGGPASLVYSVDASVIDGATRPRLSLYPRPMQVGTIDCIANVAPVKLADDTDVPVLPYAAIEDCLLPMARAKFAEVSPRYNGKNLQTLQLDRQEAERQLANMASAQKGSSRRFKLRAGF